MKRILLITIALLVFAFAPFFVRSLIYQTKFALNIYEVRRAHNFEHATDEVIYRTSPYVIGGINTVCKGTKRDLGCFGNPELDTASYYCAHACRGNVVQEAVDPFRD